MIEIKQPYILQAAHKLAMTSPYGRFKLGAIIAKNKKIISMGTNRKKSHPLQAKFTSRPDLQAWLHAEIHSISLCKVEDLLGADIYVARILANGQPGSSKPCEGCFKALKHYGIRDMYYYDEGYFCERVE